MHSGKYIILIVVENVKKKNIYFLNRFFDI
jgi:hypothetical protein